MVFDLKKGHELISKMYDDSAIPALCKYIEIPNQSPAYDKDWATNGHMEKAIDLILNWVKEQNIPNLKLKVVRLPERTPLIFMELEGQNCSDTVLMYGHMDKQPPLTESWAPGLHPHKPVIRDGKVRQAFRTILRKLYGRGGADDGYASFGIIAALKALLDQNTDRPRVVGMIEACEESGSDDLAHYVEHLRSEIGDPRLVVCLDSGCGNYDQFWLTASLRGCLMGALKVNVLSEDVHSGHASGIVPSSMRIQRILLDRLEDSQTGQVKVAALTPPIPEDRIQQQREAAEILGSEITEEFPWVQGMQPSHPDLVESLLNRNWRATVSYTGVDGMPSVATGGNVLRTSTTLKLSIRLPPHVNAKDGAAAVKKVLEENPPFGAQVSFTVLGSMGGWMSPPLEGWLDEALANASQSLWGRKHAFLGEGGSIPFMGMLGAMFPKAQFVITGVLGPKSNAHGPNEFLHIDMAKKITSSVAYVLSQVAVVKRQ